MTPFRTLNSFDIKGRNFRQKAMDPLEAAMLWPKLVALIGPTLVGLGSDGVPNELKTPEEKEVESARIVKVLREACGELGREMPGLISKFEACCQIENSVEVEGIKGPSTWHPLAVSRHFERKHLEMLEWLVTCIRNEFSDFLSETGVMDSLKAMVNLSSSPTG